MDSIEKFFAGVKQLIKYCDKNRRLNDPVLEKIRDDYLNEGQRRCGIYRGVEWEMYLKTPVVDQPGWGAGLQNSGWYCTITGLSDCPDVTGDGIDAAQDEQRLLESGFSFYSGCGHVAGENFYPYSNFQEERARIFKFIDACISHSNVNTS